MAAMKATTKRATRKASAKKAAPARKAAGKTPGRKQPAKGQRRMSQIEAAVQVLRDAGEPMTCKAMVEAMQSKGLWSSPNGRTPEATLYASILRETSTKGKDARFKKVDRGLFALA